MSSENRRKKKREDSLRLCASVVLLICALAIMIFMIKDVVYNMGLSGYTYIYGIAIIVLFFLAGNIITPVSEKWFAKIKANHAAKLKQKGVITRS